MLAVHLPAHPQQQDAAGERQADDRKHLHRDGGEDDAQHDGAGDAPEDDLGAHLRLDPRGRHADHDGVVAGEHQVDHDDLGEGDELLGEVHGKRLLVSGLDGLTGFAANPPEAHSMGSGSVMRAAPKPMKARAADT